MTIGEFKKKVLPLIEEYDANEAKLTTDPDIALKLNTCIDDIQMELATIKRIPSKLEVNTETDGHEISFPTDLYKIDKIKECGFEIANKTIFIDKDYTGNVVIYYDKYPERITDTTPDTEELEIDDDAIGCMVYGVASALLKADISSNYSVYEYKYQEMKQMLTNNKTNGMIRIG